MKNCKLSLLVLIILLVRMPSPSSENKVSLQYSDVFNQAEVLRLSGSFDKSIEYFKRCLAAAIQAGSKKEQMQSLIKLGILSWNVGLLGESATYYLSASIIAHSLGLIKTEEDCKKAIQIYNLYNAAKDYRDKEGDFQKSIDTFKKAIILSRDINSPEHELKCLRQTSVNFFNLAEFQEFHALNLEALMIAQKINNWKDEGICLNNIGLYFWKIDNYSYALQHYEKALEIAQKINNVESEADILTNISICYADLGNFEKSIELLLKVLEMDRRMNLSKQIPLDLNNIGIAYRRKALLTENDEDYIKALRYFEDSLKLARESLKGTEIQIKTEIRTLHNIGSVYSLQNKNDKALIYFDEAYNIAQRVNDIEEMSRILNNMGIVQANQGNYEQSTKYYQKAIDLALEIKEGQILWEPFFEIANSYKKLGKLSEAKQRYQNSILIIEGTRSTIELEELKASYLGTDNRLEAYHNMIDILVNLDKSLPRKGYDIEAFSYLERAKARAFLDSFEASDVSLSQGIDFKLSNRETQLNNKILNLYKKLLQSESTPEQRGKINEEIKSCEDELDKLKMEIRTTSPAYGDLKYPQIITLKEVQENLLDGKTAFFAYSIGKESSYGFAITKRSLKIFPISPRNKILKKVTEYRKVISDKDNKDFHLGNELYSELVRPGLDAKVQRLVFFPDDILYFLPFETLVIQKNDNPWLINSYNIAYAPSISSLREIIKRSKNNGNTRTKDLLAFGDPVYEEKDPEGIQTNYPDQIENFFNSQSLSLARLSYTGIEVRRIASLFKKNKEDVFLRERVSEAKFKSLKLDDFKIIHLAAHAIVDDQKPTRSFIVLSRNQDSHQYDFIQMRDIYNLRLNTDLVALSACQTGLGRLTRGEGIEGLSRAFFYAGSASVLMSLWAVNDQASYQLMERFYYHLRSSESITESLQKAKLEMIHSGVFSHPFYWAGFVITGNAGKVIFPKTIPKWIPVIISLCIGGTFFFRVKNLRRKKAKRLAARLCYRVSHD